MLAKPQSCTQILQSLIDAGGCGQLPLVLLRPRPIDTGNAFEGDFDFLMDERQFGAILRHVFEACTACGVSFIVRQQATFKRQIELIDGPGRTLTLEFWPHAEFRLGSGHGHFSRAAVTWASYAAQADATREALRAALFILHLHHKQKPLHDELTRWRLAFFRAQAGTPAPLREALAQLQSAAPDLRRAHAVALAHLRQNRVTVASPARIAGARLRRKLGRALHWPVPGVIAIVGPDGSGKSTLAAAIQDGPSGRRFRFQKFKRFFRRPLFHLFTAEPRNVRDEKMLWLVLPTAWLCFSLSRWLTGWRRPVIVDRYFYDYFVRNVRAPRRPINRIGAYGLCSRLVPRPRQLVVATSPIPVIRARKQELNEASMRQLYALYLDQVLRFGVSQALFCHTAIALDASRAHVLEFILHPHGNG